jgi:hypothetical protein
MNHRGLVTTTPKLHQVAFDVIAGLMPTNAIAARVASSSNNNWEVRMQRPQSSEKPDMAGTKRAPISLPDHPALRAVSRANGLWRVEKKASETGTRETDCWSALTRDTSREVAVQRMLALAGTRS